MKEQVNQQPNGTMSWEYEDFDNGCTLADTESGFKECAEFDGEDCKRAYQLLGGWLYNELQAFANKAMTSHIKINISFEGMSLERHTTKGGAE